MRVRILEPRAGRLMGSESPSISIRREHGYLCHPSQWRKANPLTTDPHTMLPRAGREMASGSTLHPTDRSRRDVEGTGRRRRGCPGDPEWRRACFESPDGKFIYYIKGIFRRSLEDAGGWWQGEPGASVCAESCSLSSTRGSISFRSRVLIGSIPSSF